MSTRSERPHAIEILVTRVSLWAFVVAGFAAVAAIATLLPNGDARVMTARLAIPLAVLAAGAAAFLLARVGRARSGVVLLAATTYLAVLHYVVVSAYGLHSTTMGFLPVLVVAVALLVGPRAGVAATVVGLATVVVLYALETRGVLAGPVSLQALPLVNIFVVYLLMLAVAGAISSVFANAFATALRAAEAQERQLQRLIELMPVGQVLHRDGRVLMANRAAMAIVGHDPAHPASEVNLFALLPEPTRAFAKAKAAEALRATAGESVPAGEYPLLDRHGVEHIVETRTIPVEIADGTALLTVVRDVSAERATMVELAQARDRTEAWLRTLTEDTRDAMWLVDPVRFELLAWNTAFERHFAGAFRAPLAAGLAIDAMQPDAATWWRALFARTLLEGVVHAEYPAGESGGSVVVSLRLLQRQGELLGIAAHATRVSPLPTAAA